MAVSGFSCDAVINEIFWWKCWWYLLRRQSNLVANLLLIINSVHKSNFFVYFSFPPTQYLQCGFLWHNALTDFLFALLPNLSGANDWLNLQPTDMDWHGYVYTLLDSFCTSMKTILDRALFTHKNCDFGMISARERMPALCRAYL